MIARPPPPPMAAARNGGHPIKVLVAEDVDVNRELIRLILTGHGHQVDEAEDGERALAAMTSAAYDVVLMDMEMPVMDGLQATRALRAMGGRFKDLPVIALTANAMSQQIDLCLEAGMTAHLAKPFTSETLCDTVTRWAKRPNEAQESVIAKLVRQAGPTHIEHLLRLLLTQLRAFPGPDPDDRGHLQGQAHALRGSASLFGFKALAMASRTLEDCCRMSQPVDAALADANRLIDLVHGEISQILSSGLQIAAKASAQA